MKETQVDPEHTDSSCSDETLLFSKVVIDALFTESHAGILISDPQGNIQRINRAGVEALGSPSEEATKQINLLTFPPLRDVGFSEIFRTCITDNITIIKEIPYTSKWGKSVIFRFKLIPLCDSKGVPTQVLLIFEDTKLIRISEEKLALYHKIVTNSTDAIAVLDSTGMYIEQNRAHRDLLGYSDQELKGKTPAIHLGEKVFSQIYQDLVKMEHHRREIKSTSKNGSILNLDLVSFTLKDDEGNPAYFVGIERDITDQKMAELTLKESEERYRVIAETVLDGITVTEGGKIVYANQQACSIYGYPRDEYMKMAIVDFVAPEERKRLEQMISERRKGVKVPGHQHFWIVQKDGTRRYVSTRYSTGKIGEVRRHFLVTSDITHRKLAEEDLRESERRLAEAQSIAHLGSWEWDIIKNETIWSAECYRIFGHTPEEGTITSELFLTFVHPEDRDFVIRCMEEALAKKMPYKMNHRIIRPDGQVRVIHEDAVITFDDQGTPATVSGTSQDITERIQAEIALKESENRYRNLFEYSPISLWEEDFSQVKIFFDELRTKGVVDFRDHFENNPEDVEYCVGLVSVLDVNKASIELHSVTEKSEIVGSLEKTFEKDGLGVFQEELIALAEGNTFFRMGDIPLRVKNRKLSLVFQVNVPPGYEDTLSRVYLSIIDVTERMQAERALQSTRDSALFYLDLLGHDITNQLQVIIGGTSLLQYECDEQSTTKKLNDILEAANKCAQVITKVKRTQDLMAVKLELRLLDESIEASINIISAYYSDAHITYESDVKEAQVRTDTFLDILLYELLENAIRHNPRSERNVWILVEEEEQGYSISISDNGLGIDDSRKAHLFDRAQRYGGVGLHMIKQIVDKYNGRIDVFDRIPGNSDRGVVFRIWIPKGISEE